MGIVVLTIMCLMRLALGLAGLHWEVNSTDGPDSPEWERRCPLRVNSPAGPPGGTRWTRMCRARPRESGQVCRNDPMISRLDATHAYADEGCSRMRG